MMLFVAIMTSCSEEEKNEHLNSNSYQDSKLVLNYSGSPMLGKTVTVDFYNQNVNINILGAIIPNVQFINLGSVAYQGVEGDFSFEGTTEVEGSMMAFTGNVKSDVCTLDITYELADQSLVNTWFLDYKAEIDHWGTPEYEVFPMNLTWETTSEGIELLPGVVVPIVDVVSIANSILSQLVLLETSGIKFNADGNIQAMDAKDQLIPVLNTAIYTVENAESIKVLLQLNNIITEATKPQPETRAIAGIVDMLKNGINIKYTKVGDDKLTLTFVITAEQRAIIIQLLPLIAPLAGDMSELIISMMPSIIDALEKTTKMEMSISLSTTKPVIEGGETTKSIERMFENAFTPYIAK